MISHRDANVPDFTGGSLVDDIEYQTAAVTGLYLDLDNSKVKQTQRIIVSSAVPTTKETLLLSTPDSNTFPLSTPEIQTFISTAAPVTSATITPTAQSSRFLQPHNPITSEQEMYAQGFLEALDQLHRQHEKGSDPIVHLPQTVNGRNSARDAHFASTVSLSGPNPSLASVAPTYVTATLDYIPVSHSEMAAGPASYPVVSSTPAPHDTFHVGNTYSVMNSYAPTGTPPQHHDVAGYSGYMPGSHMQFTTGSNPEFLRELHSVVPADMKTQEVLKVERKKARNRIAASKCRLRRLQRESSLQSKVKSLKDHNLQLNSEVNNLRDQIQSLKKALLHHVRTGCDINLPKGFRIQLDSVTSE